MIKDRISKNFGFSEFENSDTARDFGIDNTILSEDIRESIRALVTNVLQPLRDAVGESLHINSGYRCERLNRAVGGVSTSQHTKGEAADVRCARPYKLAQLAYDLGLPYDQMILYPNFVHFSHRRQGEQRKQVLYSRNYRGWKIKE